MPALLRDPRYRAYWLSLFLSQLGGWVQSTGLGWLVLELTGRAERLGLVLGLLFLPSLLFTLPGGALADRYPRARLLLFVEGVLATLSLLLALGLESKAVRYPHLLLFALAYGSAAALEVPTRQAFTAELAGSRRVGEALALNALSFNVARMGAPVVAGLLIARWGTPVAFWANALSFLPLLFVLARLPARSPARRRGPWARELAGGVGYAWRTPLVRQLLLLVFLVAAFGINFQALVPALARLVLGLGPLGYGSLMGALGSGALLGALVLLKSPVVRPRRVLFGAFLLGLALLLLPLARGFFAAAGLLALTGFAMVILLVSANATLQTLVPEELRGRVVALYSLVLLGSGPPGMYLTGLAFDLAGRAAPAWLGALVLAVAAYFATRPWPARLTPL